MNKQNTNILDDVAQYYSQKLKEHGDTAKGVDWNGEEGQVLRFQQLCRLIDSRDSFSIADIGCGYGALVSHLENNYDQFSYLGLDISSEMVNAASRRFVGNSSVKFEVGVAPEIPVDYCVASGIFNVRLENNDVSWQQYFIDTLDILDKASTKGFSFNCLTSYSDHDKMRDYLYYPDPSEVFSFCKKKYSKNVALLHDYDLYEFTILVRKS